ncbi:MAG: TerB family tellurite resistance protein [Sandaracinaceae bacterium]|nr:MAG: hypothetical protein EVA89_29785 [Sandaracinaceae bacterium]HBQ13207.1 hypothetical protein [Myxococcales bacterium]
MNAIEAMSTWIGALSRGGVLMGYEEEEGAQLALDVLGLERLEALRAWFSSQTRDVVERERRGAVHACIWMAQADRELATDEIEFLERVIADSELPPKVQEEMSGALDEPLELEDVAEELTQRGLRELVLGLSWQLAFADGALDDDERTAHEELAEVFGVDEERAEEIREAVLG